MLSSLGLALAAMMTTVVLLGLGFAVGCHFGRLRAAPMVIAAPTSGSSEYLPELGVCLEMAQAMESRGHVAREVATRYRKSAPPELLAAIDELILVTAKLGDQLQQISQATAMHRMTKEPQEPIAARHVVASFAPQRAEKTDMLSADEMHLLTTLAGEPTENSSSRRRYPYDCYQQVLPLHGLSPAPNLAQARTVRCHDISVHGISFFWPDEPDFNRLVISLGSDERPVHMRAEVMQSKAVYMHDEIRTLVGCRFTGRYEMQQVERPQIELQTVPDQPLSAAAALA